MGGQTLLLLTEPGHRSRWQVLADGPFYLVVYGQVWVSPLLWAFSGQKFGLLGYRFLLLLSEMPRRFPTCSKRGQ